ncbi:CPBP family intramembrane glutamic endopeptidase [Flaviaesturariibacter aridisoli]|uniref:CPBP family intramembrane metalloprotease n=1 Tax=Flaviaesturariibacter aridisoli TaxID=2545761 RepID=A0A4R4DRR4_9BACT|nr:CPBP family intramembrane glutamic endopeptidase [Flaviaesturariibacter aridisoli]TCZ65269.1 CPBP family intramembrane metalloprotease [Flaviaesturariibacter aridisoli]
MKKLLQGLRTYIRTLPLLVAAPTVLLALLLVYCNYHYGLEPRVMQLPVLLRLAAWYGLFALAFWSPYLLYRCCGRLPGGRGAPFRMLLLLAPAIFAVKLALPLPFPRGFDFWQTICYYPFKLLLIGGSLYALWRHYHPDIPFYGTASGGSLLRPYGAMLLFMVPLVALASLQPDFLAVYPKWQHLDAVRQSGPGGKLLYELSYGSDFVTIELFFRGFLVLAFARYAGSAALLPMALFYCTIHFGKPLGECISSFFGGLLLGVVTLHTRSIWGGLLVHLGIAWLMELGGTIGHQLRPDLFGY